MGGIGTGLASVTRRGPDPGLLLDADFTAGRFAADGIAVDSEVAWLEALGGSKTGSVRTFGPVVTGPQLLANGGFDTSIAGWQPCPAYLSNVSLSWQAGRLRNDFAAAGQSRFYADAPVVPGRAYRISGRHALQTAIGISQIQVSTNVNLGGSFGISGNLAAPIDTPRFVTFGAPSAPLFFGVVSNPGSAGYDLWDDFTLREVRPFAGFDPAMLSVEIAATAPATVGSGKVLMQADDGSDRNRVRLGWDADGKLRLVVRANGAEQASLDLGVLTGGSAVRVAFSVSANAVWARRNGEAPIGDASAVHPGLAQLRIGGALEGLAWEGAIDCVVLHKRPIAERWHLAVWGDSLAAGLAGRLPGSGRSVYNGGVSGNSIAQAEARLLADTTHRERIAILWDRNNSGVDTASFLAAMHAMVGRVRQHHDRIVILSDLNATDASEAPGSPTRLAREARNSALAAAYPGQYLDIVGLLDDPGLRSDGVHPTVAGYDLVVAAITARIVERNW